MKNPLSKRFSSTTKDYSLFLPVIGNRPINKKHVARLVNSMQNHGNITAIICREVPDQKIYEIMDGQHRFEAAKTCELPIEFDCWDITNRGMIALNENQKNWSLEDYLNFGVSDGLQDYITLKNFREETGLSMVALLEIFGANKYDSARSEGAIRFSRKGGNKEFGIRYDAFKRLEWGIPNLARSEEILRMLKDFYEKFNVSHWRMQRFIAAFISILNSGLYDHEVMMKQMEKCSGLLRRQANQGEYVRNFEMVYNYNSSKIKRTVFSKN